MEICRHLAMTRWEMENFTLPEGFSPAFLSWERELSDLPERLPENTLLVLCDRFPMEPPEKILQAVEKTGCQTVLLDFQKPDREALIKALLRFFPKAAVSEPYAHLTEGPVFLPPCPPDKPLADHLAPWKNREIWLDTAPEILELTVTPTGCTPKSLQFPPNPPCFTHESLHCRYKTEILPTEIRFTLWRDREMLEAHTLQAQTLGITKTVTLFQEWHSTQ
jgi:hypothetical protein